MKSILCDTPMEKAQVSLSQRQQLQTASWLGERCVSPSPLQCWDLRLVRTCVVRHHSLCDLLRILFSLCPTCLVTLMYVLPVCSRNRANNVFLYCPQNKNKELQEMNLLYTCPLHWQIGIITRYLNHPQKLLTCFETQRKIFFCGCCCSEIA